MTRLQIDDALVDEALAYLGCRKQRPTLGYLDALLIGDGPFPHGPAMAAVIVVTLTAVRSGLRAFWTQMTGFRAGRWYLIGSKVMVFHYASNLFTGGMMLRAFTGGDHETYYILFVLLACLAALASAWGTKFKLRNP